MQARKSEGRRITWIKTVGGLQIVNQVALHCTQSLFSPRITCFTLAARCLPGMKTRHSQTAQFKPHSVFIFQKRGIYETLYVTKLRVNIIYHCLLKVFTVSTEP